MWCASRASWNNPRLLSRRPHKTDAALLAELHRACLPPGWPEAGFAGLLMDSATDGELLLDDKGALHAFLLYRPVVDECEILTLAVAEHARRLGLARRLLKRMEVAVQESGVTRLLLDVAEDNAAALALYEGLGYAAYGSRPGYYQRGEAKVTAVTMHKLLVSGSVI